MFVSGWKQESGIKDGVLPSPAVAESSVSVKNTLKVRKKYELIPMIPIGPDQNQHSTIDKTHCKTNSFSIMVLTWGKYMPSGKVEIIEEGQTATEDVPEK